MLKIILLAVAVALAALCVVIAMRPSEFRVTRSLTMSAQPAAIFPLVNDLHQWQYWSPWAKLDPNAKESFGGPYSGVGSSFAWAGNNEVGVGKMTITDAKPNESVTMLLEFEKPMAGKNNVIFSFEPQGAETKVTWTMYGPANFVSKAMGLFMNCDKLCGDQFEKGLGKLHELAKASAQPALTKVQ